MGKVLLITGCSSGLGRLLVQQLSFQKNYLIYASVRSDSDIIKFRELWQDNSNIKVIKLDITKDTECQKAILLIKKNEARLDVLINNAGYTLAGPSLGFTVSEYTNILDTNAVGAFRLMKEAIPLMQKTGGGRIINITSLNGLVSLPNFGLYSSSKFALEALSRALSIELGESGITITNIEPGAIKMADEGKLGRLPHTAARDKLPILKILLPMISGDEVVKAVLKLIVNPNPPLGVVLGRDAKIITFLNRYFPRLWTKMLTKVWRK